MHAMVLHESGGRLHPEQRPVPEGSDVIEVLACGVCHSDLHVVDGVYPSPLPLVLGHEVTGMHAQLGPVMLYAPWGCRSCEMCASGQEMICPDSKEIGIFQDGGYTEHVAVSRREYLHPLGDLDPVTSAPLACGGLTAYRAVTKVLPSLRLARPTRVAVIGAGGLGQFAIQYVRMLSDATVVAADPSPSKQARAMQLGADVAVPLTQLADAGPFDAIIDFVGADDTLTAAVRSVRRQGIVVVVGLYGGRVPFGLGAVPHEAHLTTSIWGTNDELGELIALAGREHIRHTVETLPLSAANEAHDRLRRGDVAGRLVLVPALDRSTT
jgi:alcohol dehydrogenase, propanol-preferring